LALGAKDFVLRPYDASEMLLHVKNLLETRFMHLQLQANNVLLEDELERRTLTAEHAHLESIVRLALAAEFRDDDTGQHTQRVGRLSARLAEALGMGAEDVSLIRSAAPLHDVGKIGIPDGILLKRGKLDDGEMGHMKAHTIIGAKILSGSRFPLLQLAEEIALTHHERWDGNGYVPGLEGEGIPLASRIVAVVDAYDALTNARPYKAAWSQEAALEEIRRQSGRQFDPRVARTFIELVRAYPTCALDDDPTLDPTGLASPWHTTAPAPHAAPWRDQTFRSHRQTYSHPTDLLGVVPRP
jgi:putative two-component system response regulator